MNSDRMRLSASGSGDGAQGEPSVSEQIEVLASRLADGEGSPDDWETFGALAQRVPDAWQQLARAQRDHAALSVAVGVALHAADRVELPSREAAENFHAIAGEHGDAQRIMIWSRVRTWGGWAAAAALTLAWWTGGHKGLTPGQSPSSVGNTATLLPGRQVNTPEEAFSAYLDLGSKGKDTRVLGEAPQRIVLDKHPTADGKGYEIITVRQVIEKITVRELVDFPAMDESGKLIPRAVSPTIVPDSAQ